MLSLTELVLLIILRRMKLMSKKEIIPVFLCSQSRIINDDHILALRQRILMNCKRRLKAIREIIRLALQSYETVWLF